MINLIEGQLDFGTKKVSVFSDNEELDTLANQGILERRNDTGKGKPYFYVESNEDGRRFGTAISLRGKKIEWLLLRWLNGPCTGKDWDKVSDEAMKSEYGQLLNFVRRRIGVPPDDKTNRQSTWHVKWGEIEVSYEPRDFVVAILMTPR